MLEFLAADGRELDAQMAAFTERVRPRLARTSSTTQPTP